MDERATAEVLRRLKAAGLEPVGEDLEGLLRALARVERDLAALAQVDLGQREPALVFSPPPGRSKGGGVL